MIKGMVIYDSFTGNTRKIAERIAVTNSYELKKVEEAPLDLQDFGILIIGSLNVRASFSEKIKEYIAKANLPKKIAIFVTFGVPVWGQISSMICFKDITKRIQTKGSKVIAKFSSPGYHVKFKTYPSHPCAKDLLRAEKFALAIKKKLC